MSRSIALRPYQMNLKRDVYQSWTSGARNVVAVSPTGSGKSLTMASMAFEFGENTCAIAHRQELVQQISIAMAQVGLPHNIIAPDKVISTIISRHIIEFGKSYLDRRSRMTVVGVDTLIRRKDDKSIRQWANTVRYWQGDECFPAGTLVDGTPIENVKVGDKVTAFDETTGQLSIRPVTHVFKNPMPDEMVCVRTALKKLLVTANHPFWTQRGWVNAIDLTTDDDIHESDLTPTRVVGVTVLERGHPDFPAGDFVYNIEVDGLNTYFADGIAVHNCHHFLQNNKWGTAVQMFPNARGVGFTATPIRCDRKSLHVEQGGVFDDLVVGPSMRELIDLGFLADYMIYGPPISINEAKLQVSKNTGEFTPASLKSAEDHSTLHGDIVQHYLKLAAGKRGITFVHSVDAATDVANKFREAGVPAECVSAKTPDAVRNSVIDKFRKGTVLQLVNVDLFGEGFDVPAVEVVSMGRATQSFGLYVQQLGRALRPKDEGKRGIIIDHVGNVKRHGLPDAVKTWSLKADERGRKRQVVDEEVIPVTSCTACFATYERIHKQCPFCGHVEEPAARNDPKFVDGDLIEFGPELLAELRRQAASVVAPFDAIHDVPVHLRGTPAEWAIKKRYETRREAHGELADTIALWAGVRRDRGMADSEIYRRFYHMFGVDVATAQTLRELKAIEDLTARIKENYWR